MKCDTSVTCSHQHHHLNILLLFQDLRRQRKRLKRESMGLTYDPLVDSPPLPAQPRRLSETNAATTLAFFKQQTPPDFRQYQPQPQPQPQPQQHQQQPPLPPQAPTPIIHDVNVGGALRRKQKYTIKNVEAWGERHGRPAAHDPSGRALWKRPSDGSLVYLTCPISGCEKDDFVTLHGFMCHLTKKHKDRSLGSQSRALEICGIVYDPNAPLLPVPKMHRDSTEESQPESAPADANSHELEYSSSAVEDDDEPVPPHAVKTEPVDRAPPFARTPVGPEDDATTPPLTNRSTKPSISSIIDHEPEDPPREMLSESAPPPFIDAAAAVTPASSHQSADGNNEFKDSPDTK
ncbi:hypothetical protein MAP00_003435 [Monascus purpureus]|nr:hypothetical protein MAP00_003435 [Monascus purpureus]